MVEQFENRYETLLNGAIDSDDTTIVVDAGPVSMTGQFRIKIEDELILVGTVSGSTFSSCTRGVEGTTAVSHSDNTVVTHVLTAASLLQGIDDNGQGHKDFGFIRYTAGDIVCDADNVWEDMAGPGDITLTAATGDWIEVGVSFGVLNTTAQSCGFDVGTVVSGSIVNHISSGAAPDNAQFGVTGWRAIASAQSKASGSVLYQLQSGDITSGTVVLRLRDHPEGSTNRDVNATTARPLHFWAKNLGPSL